MAGSSDVIIAGGGPVGMGLAIDLATRGVTVCLIERHREPQRIPKGQNLTQRTGEHFARWGISKAIRDATPIPPEYGNEGLTAYGSLLSGYHYDWFKRASVRRYYAADNERLPQYETERILRERCQQCPQIDLRLGWRFSDYQITASGVDVSLVEVVDGDEATVHGRYLVGCDGARSRVRELAGMPETVDARGRRMALLVFRSVQLHTLLDDRFKGKTIFNALDPALEGYWQFLGRVNLEGSWFFHAPVPDDAARDNYDFEGLVQRAVGTRFEIQLEYVGFWDLRFTQVDCYGAGRVFIAGDAAHSHPPYGGYGVNVGFEDVRNLSWKLTAVLAGWASPALLDSYSEERHPVFASTRDNFIARMIRDDEKFTATYNPTVDRRAFEQAWHQRASGGQTEVQRYVPNYAGSPIVWGEPGARSGAVGEHSLRAEAGFHLAPLPLSNGARVYEHLGQAFVLIAVGPQASNVQRFIEAAEALTVPLKIVATAATDDTLQWGAKLILVRPDEFVAFASNELSTTPFKILQRAIGIDSSDIKI